ncbi:DedA family protein [Actinomycetospora aeridis]|uniref:DedA family protein n=1 Tax=Actinomycetospora aeridis TaxID=3129231 RepID=A0ABU8NG48_9PSEU
MTGAGAGTERDDLTEPVDDDATPTERTTTDTPEESAPARKKRFRWRKEDYTEEEWEEARQAMRKAVPWDGPMKGGDWFLIIATFSIVALNLASMPFRPFLLASHPIGLAAVTGSLSAVGAGAAFAAIGQGPLWLVIVAGVFGMIKFDWLFWLAGRRWGAKIVEMFAPGDVAQRFVGWVRSAPPWVMGLAVVLSALPGIPAPAVFALAGLGRMRLVSFLVLDAIGAALIAGLVAGLGYGIGQHAVDVVLAVDRYALWITLTLVVVVSVRAGMKAQREQKAQKAAEAREGQDAAG